MERRWWLSECRMWRIAESRWVWIVMMRSRWCEHDDDGEDGGAERRRRWEWRREAARRKEGEREVWEPGAETAERRREMESERE